MLSSSIFEEDCVDVDMDGMVLAENGVIDVVSAKANGCLRELIGR